MVPLALLSRGVRPRWADIDPATLNLDPAAAAAARTPRTRAILFQRTYGLPGGASDLLALARTAGVPLIEDCAQCMPLRLPAHPVVGDAAIYSNNLLKPLPAGSGGLAATDNEELYLRLRELRKRLPGNGPMADFRLALEGALQATVLTPRRYWSALSVYRRLSPAYRSLPLEEQIVRQIRATAAAPSRYQERRGLRWLARMDRLADHRREVGERYRRELAGHPALRVLPASSDLPLLYLPVLTEDKNSLLRSARAARQEVIPWPGQTPIYPLESVESLGQLGYTKGACPVAEQVASRLVGLPTHFGMTPVERDRLLQFLSHWRPVGSSE